MIFQEPILSQINENIVRTFSSLAFFIYYILRKKIKIWP